jgi:hypothetical protein
MNPGRFFIPGNIRIGSIPFSSPAIGPIATTARNAGLFSRISNGVRSFNWSGLLTNANKTLNVVNQAIPLVRQAGPMVSNMKNMLKIARVFGNETANKSNINNNTNFNSNENIKKDITINNSNVLDNNSETSSLNFFV